MNDTQEMQQLELFIEESQADRCLVCGSDEVEVHRDVNKPDTNNLWCTACGYKVAIIGDK